MKNYSLKERVAICIAAIVTSSLHLALTGIPDYGPYQLYPLMTFGNILGVLFLALSLYKKQLTFKHILPYINPAILLSLFVYFLIIVDGNYSWATSIEWLSVIPVFLIIAIPVVSRVLLDSSKTREQN